MRTRQRRHRSFIAPEVIQASALECGPAALHALLQGYRLASSYAALLQECRTHLDGTSIDALEQIAVASGLDAEQIMVPEDHLSARMLPAILVVRRDNLTHFVLAWRTVGRFVQVMDPARGRRWVHERSLRRELHAHHHRVETGDWRAFAGSPEFLTTIDDLLRGLEVPRAARRRLIEHALADTGWSRPAALDAAIRMVRSLVLARAVRRGREAAALLERLTTRCDPSRPYAAIPAAYWSVLPDPQDAEGDHVILRGAVLLRIRGLHPEQQQRRPAASRRARPTRDAARPVADAERPGAQLWRLLLQDGVGAPALLAVAAVLAAAGALAETLLLRASLDLTSVVTTSEGRLAGVALLVGLATMLLLLDVAIATGLLRIGRRVELRLRTALLERLPRLRASYFEARLMADLAHRAHSIETLRELPEIGGRLVRASAMLVFTTLAITFLDPASGGLAAASAVLALLIPLGSQRLLAERDLRQRNHAAAVSGRFLDSLLGLFAAKMHGGDSAVRRRHEATLVEWCRSSLVLLRAGVMVEAAQMLVGSAIAALLVLDFLARSGRPGAALLLIYWALSLPLLGREVAGLLRRMPTYRNVMTRLLEPMTAPAEPAAGERPADAGPDAAALSFAGVGFMRSGRPILSHIDLDIAAGEHVAIVGRSGAGKSTLLALLLGWYTPTSGTIRLDGHHLEGSWLAALRRATAWVDPSVCLWNRSLFENLKYGDSSPVVGDFGAILETANLHGVLEKLPAGLQSALGEGGRLTSGGEGQRVRFGRALAKRQVRLALLDEPFRGLDSRLRSRLLARARHVWRNATFICVTHDIAETLSFPRVLVLDDGRVAEDGQPGTLAKDPTSLYARLLAADQAATTALWNDGQWAHWRLARGHVVQEPAARATSQKGTAWRQQQR